MNAVRLCGTGVDQCGRKRGARVGSYESPISGGSRVVFAQDCLFALENLVAVDLYQ
jgi:hypothetical protein